jgi:hypothetical protein
MIVNLAHVLRKQRRFAEAERHYLTALSFAPSQAGTLAALAYTCLLQVCPPATGTSQPQATLTLKLLKCCPPSCQELLCGGQRDLSPPPTFMCSVSC